MMTRSRRRPRSAPAGAVLVATLATLFVVCAVGARQDRGLPPATPPATQPSTPTTAPKPPDVPALPTPEQLFVQGIEKAHHADKWYAHDAIRTHISVEFGRAQGFQGVLTYDIHTGRSRIDTDDGTRLVFDGAHAWVAPAESTFSMARFHLRTWPYFLAAPFKLADPGTHLVLTDMMSLNLKLCQTARLTFDAGTGDTSDDWYYVFVDPETGRLAGLSYIVTYGTPIEAANADPHAIVYSGYRSVDGVKLSSNWTFYKWSVEVGTNGPPVGRVRLSDTEFITPEDGTFDRPPNAREDKLP